ncbi:MAG: DUF692 domain-containing protein [Pikeienuella sp.]|uniref:MNIO family bufferin maturase n=1 Tax=Pikeienuella sp. TaxID=2831957 RepID=UPI003919A2C1
MTGLPRRAGVSFKPEHFAAIMAAEPDVGFFEVHAENYMGAGGPPHRMLSAIRERWPLSLHGVGLSIGGEGRLDRAHLARLRALVERHAPARFSEHLAWSTHEGVFFNDLLPLPYTEATLARVADHVDEAQEALGVPLLLENPSAYVDLEGATMGETEFLREVARRTGCGLLLDINNVVVSAANRGFDAEAWLDAFPLDRVGEVHLAGHAVETGPDGERLLIDAHDRAVGEAVWSLYARALTRSGPLPTLIEWDADIPALDVLLAEAEAAERIMEAARPHALAG